MTEQQTRTFQLLRMEDGRKVVNEGVNFLAVEGVTGVIEEIQAKDWFEARQKFSQMETRTLAEAKAEVARKPSVLPEDAPFKSAHAALLFAFNYAGQQSPKTPLTTLLRGPGLGKGVGLSGLDGAAQAGMILRALDTLPAEQRHVLTVRFGDFRHECACCGQPAPSDDWREALDALSHCVELEGLPRIVRHAAIERAVCRRKWDSKRLSADYGLSLRTLQEQVKRLKARLARVETNGLAALDEWLRDGGSVGEAA